MGIVWAVVALCRAGRGRTQHAGVDGHTAGPGHRHSVRDRALRGDAGPGEGDLPAAPRDVHFAATRDDGVGIVSLVDARVDGAIHAAGQEPTNAGHRRPHGASSVSSPCGSSGSAARTRAHVVADLHPINLTNAPVELGSLTMRGALDRHRARSVDRSPWAPRSSCVDLGAPSCFASAFVAILFLIALLVLGGAHARSVGRSPSVNVTSILIGSSATIMVLIFGSLSGVMCERAGVVNIAIEGQFIAGAFFGEHDRLDDQQLLLRGHRAARSRAASSGSSSPSSRCATARIRSSWASCSSPCSAVSRRTSTFRSSRPFRTSTPATSRRTSRSPCSRRSRSSDRSSSTSRASSTS